MDKITKAFPSDVSVNDGERAVTAKISTVSVDRDGEVLIPQGCYSKSFERNPVVFLNHNYWTLPVGKCVSIQRKDDCLIAKTVFAERPDDYPEDQEWVPDTLLSLFKQGVIRGFSVGFVPKESRPATDKDIENYGAGCRRVYSKWEMLEYSVAPLPANQDAVALAVSKGFVSESAAKAFLGYEVKPEEQPATDDNQVEFVTKSTEPPAEPAPANTAAAPEPQRILIVIDDIAEPQSIDVKQIQADQSRETQKQLQKAAGRMYFLSA